MTIVMTKCGSVLGLLCSTTWVCSTWVWRESLGRVGPLVITAGSRAASRPASSAVRTTTLSALPSGTGTQVRVPAKGTQGHCQVQVLYLAYHQVQDDLYFLYMVVGQTEYFTSTSTLSDSCMSISNMSSSALSFKCLPDLTSLRWW